jgi:hypothetical protein
MNTLVDRITDERDRVNSRTWIGLARRTRRARTAEARALASSSLALARSPEDQRFLRRAVAVFDEVDANHLADEPRFEQFFRALSTAEHARGAGAARGDPLPRGAAAKYALVAADARAAGPRGAARGRGRGAAAGEPAAAGHRARGGVRAGRAHGPAGGPGAAAPGACSGTGRARWPAATSRRRRCRHRDDEIGGARAGVRAHGPARWARGTRQLRRGEHRDPARRSGTWSRWCRACAPRCWWCAADRRRSRARTPPRCAGRGSAGPRGRARGCETTPRRRRRPCAPRWRRRCETARRPRRSRRCRWGSCALDVAVAPFVLGDEGARGALVVADDVTERERARGAGCSRPSASRPSGAWRRT